MVPPGDAALFNVNIRIPAAMTADILASSGLQGVYFEPRGDVGEASKEYQVTWMPKQHEEVLGIARVGSRYGLRSHVANAKALRVKVRPDVPYLPKAEIRFFQVRPVHHGTQCQALSVMLDALPWATKPLHPLPGQRDARQTPSVVGSRQTIRQKQTSAPVKEGPGQPNEEPDPWMQFLHKQGRTVRGPDNSRSGPTAAPVPSTMFSEDAVAKKVEARVAASIATQVREQLGQAMHASQAAAQDRFNNIEKQVESLRTRVESQESSMQKMMCEMMDQPTLRLEDLIAPKRRKDGLAHE